MSLKQAVSVIEQEVGHLNALFCNAGQGLLRALGQATSYEITQLFDINVFGVMRTIECCLPLLKAAPNGSHLLATSSISGLVGQPMNEIYCASKFALEGLFESLATYYKPFFSIDVTLIEPAAVETNFTANVLDRLEQTGGLHEDDFKPIIESYLRTYRVRHAERQSPETIAELTMARPMWPSSQARVIFASTGFSGSEYGCWKNSWFVLNALTNSQYSGYSVNRE